MICVSCQVAQSSHFMESIKYLEPDHSGQPNPKDSVLLANLVSFLIIVGSLTFQKGAFRVNLVQSLDCR